MDNKKSYDIDDVIALAVKITVVLAAIGGAVYGLIKLNQYFRDRYICSCCDFCDDDLEEDFECECEDCKNKESTEEVKEEPAEEEKQENGEQ